MRRKLPAFFLIFLFFLSSCYQEKGKSVLYLNGRVEGEEYDIGTKVPGKVNKVFVREGEDVEKGQVLATLDSKAVTAKVAQAEALLKAAESSEDAKKEEIKIFRQKLAALKNRYTSQKNSLNSQLEIAKEKKKLAEKDLKLTEFAVSKARAVYLKTKKDFERYKTLYEKRVISKAEFDKVKTAFDVAYADFNSAKENFKKAEDGIKIASLSVNLVESKFKELDALKRETDALAATVKAKEKEYEVFENKVAQAEAVLEEAKSHLEDTVVRSPVNGTVTVKYINEGEVIPAGYRLFSIVDMNSLYLKGYISEKDIGLIHLNQPAYIKVDSFPEKRFPAFVSYIAQKAEFTPKEVQTKEERVKSVFAVKLKLKENPSRKLKPGMPADGYIELK